MPALGFRSGSKPDFNVGESDERIPFDEKEDSEGEGKEGSVDAGE